MPAELLGAVDSARAMHAAALLAARRRWDVARNRQGLWGPVWGADRLRFATDAAGVALWSWNVDTDEIALDERAHGLWGVPKSNGLVTFEDLSARIHPEDLDRVRAAFTATRDLLGGYEIDFRIMYSDEVRWISARGRGEVRHYAPIPIFSVGCTVATMAIE